MLEGAHASPYDAQPARAARIGARDFRVRRHPVVLCRHALLRGEQGQNRT